MVNNSKNPKKSQKVTFFKLFLFIFFFAEKKLNKNTLSYPVLGGCNSTRVLQSSPFQEHINLKKTQKIIFFQQFFFNIFFCRKKK